MLDDQKGTVVLDENMRTAVRAAVRAHSLTLLHVLAFHVEDVQYGIKYPTPVKLLQ